MTTTAWSPGGGLWDGVRFADVAVNATSLRVWEFTPTGPPCVFLHGLGDSAYVWNDFARVHCPGLRTLALDLRGHGDSQWQPSGEYWPADLACDVAAVLDGLGMARVILVGHSLGAHVAIRVAAEHPGRVAGLVIVDWAPNRNPDVEAHVRSAITDRSRVYDTDADFMKALGKGRVLVASDMLRRVAASLVRRREDGRFETKCDPALGVFDDREDLPWATLRRVSARVLIVRGIWSAVLSRPAAEQMVRAFRDARLSVVTRAGHDVMLDNPDGFARAVRPFLMEYL